MLDLEHDGRLINNGVKIKTNNLLNLFWGIRIKPEIYSKKVIDYFYDQLEVKDAPPEIPHRQDTGKNFLLYL